MRSNTLGAAPTHKIIFDFNILFYILSKNLKFRPLGVKIIHSLQVSLVQCIDPVLQAIPLHTGAFHQISR
ncbi:MAG: hypothetical protein ACI9E1_001639 [Cryomorphaceae bacterium]|jgi:hypothetical protein